MRRSYCAIVSQQDHNWTFLTCREHVELAYAFYQAAATSQQHTEATQELLGRMGLSSCADLQAGKVEPGEMGPVGLSGGQHRRLSLAVAIAKKPALLIADEPTSGLDAAAAAGIMKAIRDLASFSRVAVLCTVHQPSASILDLIDNLLILTKGCPVYNGAARELVNYASALGKPAPLGVSISEHMLNFVNADFASDAEVDKILDAWRKQRPPQPVVSRAALPPEPVRASFARQAKLLFIRHALKLMPRDPLIFIAIAIMSCMDISWVGIYFWNQLRTDDQRRASATLNFSINGFALPMMYNLFYTIGISSERLRVKREISNAQYSVALYVLITTAIMIPVSLLTGFLTSALVYLWGDFHWGAYAYQSIVVGASGFYCLSLAQLCGWLLGTTTGPMAFSIIMSLAFSTYSQTAAHYQHTATARCAAAPSVIVHACCMIRCKLTCARRSPAVSLLLKPALIS